MDKFSNNYNLEERTARFGDTISSPIINQIIRSSTSIGANYMEANGASSKKDFQNKIFICKKESQETKHWLRMLTKCFPDIATDTRILWKEVQELTLIFQKICSSLKIDKMKIE